MGKSKNIKEKIAVLTDTGSYLFPKEAEELGIYLLPLQIIEDTNDGTITYLDLIDVNSQDIYQKLNQDITLKTSLPLYSTIYETLQQIKKDGFDNIIAIPLTPGISSTASNIYSIANELNLPISIIDTYTSCQIQNHIVKEVKDLVDHNYSREEIVTLVNQQIEESNSIILAKDINHLKNGGRITPAAATLASMLKIFPILIMNKATEGKIDVFDKVRTEKKAKRILVEETLKHIQNDNYEIYVIHSDDNENAEFLKEELKKNGIKEQRIHINDFSSVISVHVGMKCLATQIIKNIEIKER